MITRLFIVLFLVAVLGAQNSTEFTLFFYSMNEPAFRKEVEGERKRAAKVSDGFSVYRADQLLTHGDPTGYDIQVKRQGEGLQTEYFITPRQKKPLSDADSALIAANTIDLRKAVKADGEEDPYCPYSDE